MDANTHCINGNRLSRMLVGGTASLAANAQRLNSLNVFPVSDGDTGTNMLKTMEGGIAQAQRDESEHIGRTVGSFARGALLSARGNSGVILSQIFAGIAEELAQLDAADAKQIARAYRKGIEKSYAAVQNPTEGTILTVFRESTDYAAAALTEQSTVEDFFRLHIERARQALAETKELLPVLKEADVVDSGAAGYLNIAEGMYRALTGEAPVYTASADERSASVDIDRFTRESVLEFGYCTEFLLRLTNAKVDPDTFALNTVLGDLKALGGESVVAYKQGDIVKVHVHTFTPGAVLTKMQQYGEFLTLKIENMSLGHSGTLPEKPKSTRAFSVVAVACGDGLGVLFSQMGADQIISGGQTANPSIEQFVEAFQACGTKDILVLPNNKNILLAARQAAQIYTDATVHVIESKSMVQGYSALSVITPGITDIDALTESARRAAESVVDAQITRAVRDAQIDGVNVHSGDYIAILGGKIAAVAETAEQAVLAALETEDTDLCEIITLFVGKNVSDERRAALTEQLKETYADCEVTVYEGGQDVYDYFVGLE